MPSLEGYQACIHSEFHETFPSPKSGRGRKGADFNAGHIKHICAKRYSGFNINVLPDRRMLALMEYLTATPSEDKLVP